MANNTKSSLFNFQLQPESYYLLRRPILPIETVLQLHEATAESQQPLLPALLSIFRAPLLQEAIYVASPALHAALLKAIESKENNSNKKSERLTIALYKYLLRMSTRCTPYGLFAGCSLGQLADSTSVSYAAKPLRKLARLDMNYVSELVQHLLSNPLLKEKLLYYPNNSLYRVANKYRYVEYQVKGRHRTYKIVSVAYSVHLASMLAAAKDGCTIPGLVKVILAASPTTPQEVVQRFVQQVIDSQLLVSELEPTVTGDNYLEGLPARLQGKVPDEQVEALHRVLQLLIAGGVDNFQQINQLLQANFCYSGSQDLLQLDLFLETKENHLKSSVAATIARQLSELSRLATRTTPPDLASFIKDFYERFEEQQVPLLLALDSESGLGYGLARPGSGDYLPLIEGIIPQGEPINLNTSWTRSQYLVFELYHRALRNKSLVVNLMEDDLAKLDEPSDLAGDTPASMYALGSLLAESAESLDSGQFQFALSAYAGPSAANLLGRFCYGDEDLLENIRETLRSAEPDTDAVVYAEVVHLPEARTGNILMRPHLRTYEIPFLSPSSQPAENQIPVQDLLVSVRQGQVILRSQRLNKRIIPRLSTAHNYKGGQPIYRFLCDLQYANLYTGVNWNWGALREQPFLPRVQYRNIIVAKARWIIRRNELVPSPVQKDSSLDSRLKEYLMAHNVPRYCSLSEEDNELLIDTEYSTARLILLQYLEKHGQVKIVEFLSTKERCFLQTQGQSYTNEVLLPLRNPRLRKAMLFAQPLKQPAVRQFPPGSEWVYLKLYGGNKSIDQLLTDIFLPLAQKWKQQGLIRQWFFVRYADPASHLRIRFRMSDDKLEHLAAVVKETNLAFALALNQGQLHRMQFDTYVRELERYGPENMDNTEALFSHDSQATAGILSLLGGDDGETYRWLLALRGLDQLLSDFGLPLLQKHLLLKQISESFFREFNGNKNLQVQLNEKYRQNSRQIQDFLNPLRDAKNGIEEAVRKFEQRSEDWRATIALIQALYPDGLMASERGRTLLSDYVHMYINRFVLAQPRLHELTMYAMLYKSYTSKLANNEAAN